MIPLKLPEELLGPKDLRNIVSYVRKRDATKPKFDFVNIRWTIAENREAGREKVSHFIDAGMT